MKRDPSKYIWKNKIGADCQLVTAVNAYYYLTGELVDDITYENYVDLCKCRNGSAISIEKVWKRLGIDIIWAGNSLLDFKTRCYGNDLPIRIKRERKKKIPLPLEFNIWHKDYGFHSTLIVDHEPRVDCYKITNFKSETSHDGWIFAEDIYKFERRMPNNNGVIFRLFGLKSDPISKEIKKLWKKQVEH